MRQERYEVRILRMATLRVPSLVLYCAAVMRHERHSNRWLDSPRPQAGEGLGVRDVAPRLLLQRPTTSENLIRWKALLAFSPGALIGKGYTSNID